MTVTKRNAAITVAAALAALVAACASNEERPTGELARARTLVDQARQSDAQQFASADLQNAQDKLRQADSAADKERYADARRLAVEASLDAELAVAKTRTGKAEAAAEEVAASLSTLQQEAARSSGASRPAAPPTPPPNPDQN